MNIDAIKSFIRDQVPGIAEHDLGQLTGYVLVRQELVGKMALATPLSHEWNQISEAITICDSVLAPWGLV